MDAAGRDGTTGSARSATRARWVRASWLGLAALLGLVAAFGTDAGVSYDEQAQRTYGDLVLAWFRSGFEDARANHFYDLYLYGGLFDAVAQWLVERSPLGPFETRHVLTALVGVVGIVATWLLGARIAGARAGFFGACMLALTPAWVGHSLFNPKDIPFGTAAAFVSVAALRIATGPAAIRGRDAFLAGIAVGFALAARPGGVFVLAYPLLAGALRVGLELLRRRRAGQGLGTVRLTARLAAAGAIIVITAWPIMVSAWPWAQLDPILRPLEAMRAARRFSWNASMLWDGRTVWAADAPPSYLPLWFNVTLPELYLVASLSGLALLIRIALRRTWQGERAVAVATLATSVLLPLAAVFVTRPVLYDAHRHFLFLLPPLAALAGCAVSELLAARWIPRVGRGAVGVTCAALSAFVVVDMIQLHPYQYTYFNRWAGGLRKQYRRYETDYWGVSYKEGLEWVVRELEPARPGRPIRVAGCDLSANERLQYYRRQWPGAAKRIRVVSGYERADVYLAVRRYECHKVPGEILHVVRRQRAPLLYVIRRPKSP